MIVEIRKREDSATETNTTKSNEKDHSICQVITLTTIDVKKTLTPRIKTVEKCVFYEKN